MIPVEKLHAGFRLGDARRPGREREQQSPQGSRSTGPAFVDEQGKREERDPESQRPLVAFNWAMGKPGIDLPFLEFA